MQLDAVPCGFLLPSTQGTHGRQNTMLAREAIDQQVDSTLNPPKKTLLAARRCSSEGIGTIVQEEP
jgi:hypothetical protein